MGWPQPWLCSQHAAGSEGPGGALPQLTYPSPQSLQLLWGLGL